jgi:hypothetical protein
LVETETEMASDPSRLAKCCDGPWGRLILELFDNPASVATEGDHGAAEELKVAGVDESPTAVNGDSPGDGDDNGQFNESSMPTKFSRGKSSKQLSKSSKVKDGKSSKKKEPRKGADVSGTPPPSSR